MMNKETRKFVYGYSQIAVSVMLGISGLQQLEADPLGWHWVNGVVNLFFCGWFFFKGTDLVKSTIAKDAP